MVRLKSRYFLCNVIFPNPEERGQTIASTDLYYTIDRTAKQLFGDFGMAMICTRLRVIKDVESELAVIRVQRSAAKMLSQLLPFIKEHRKRSIILQTLHVAGTLRACQKFRLKYERRCLLSLLKCSQSAAERRVIQESLMRCAATPEEDSDIEVDE